MTFEDLRLQARLVSGRGVLIMTGHSLNEPPSAVADVDAGEIFGKR
jgi:hypothetical protein